MSSSSPSLSPVLDKPCASDVATDDTGKGIQTPVWTEDDLASSKFRNRISRVTSFVLGIATIAAVIIGTFFFMEKNQFKLKKKEVRNGNFQGVVSPETLKTHNVSADCWLALHDNVYDLTQYALEHPGGPEYITDFCGTDATKEYDMEHHKSLLNLIPENLLGTYESISDEPSNGTTTDSVNSEASSSNADEPDEELAADTSTYKPSAQPSALPSMHPSISPSKSLSSTSNVTSTNGPSSAFTMTPSRSPSFIPTVGPTMSPSNSPIVSPFVLPNVQMSFPPGMQFIFQRTNPPTAGLIGTPAAASQSSSQPTAKPTFSLTLKPASAPTKAPTIAPTTRPTRQPTLRPTPSPTRKPTYKPTKPAESCQKQFYTIGDVQLHADQSDCWYVLYGRVYDFTDYIDRHPGGARRIFNECGTDATAAYSSEKKHDENLLAKDGRSYLIGTLGTTSGVQDVPC